MENWFIGITSYFVIWWIAIFIVLPWGVEREINPQAGHDPGAPKNPNLAKKFIGTSIAAAIIWIIIYAMIMNGVFEFLMNWIGPQS